MWTLVKEYERFNLWAFKGIYKECFFKNLDPNKDEREIKTKVYGLKL